MGRVFRRNLREFEILDWWESRFSDTTGEFRDELSVTHFLSNFLGDPLSMATLRQILAERVSSGNISQLEDREVIQQLIWRVAGGEIHILPRRETPAVKEEAAAASSKREAAVIEEAPPPPTRVKESKWVKFLIVDDESGQPVEGVVLTLKLPDGTVKDFRTNAGGTVEIRDLPPGSCELQKMEDPDAFEVVRVE
ncbi:MAG: carboxypeptidase-like regulatory domain-containing protein [candidate division Zixibacteria bacterium]|nr:carboxypeptidase-like regulatory domain-containing protein [candidate division Zixibacteria bacterium]